MFFKFSFLTFIINGPHVRSRSKSERPLVEGPLLRCMNCGQSISANLSMVGICATGDVSYLMNEPSKGETTSSLWCPNFSSTVSIAHCFYVASLLLVILWFNCTLKFWQISVLNHFLNNAENCIIEEKTISTDQKTVDHIRKLKTPFCRSCFIIFALLLWNKDTYAKLSDVSQWWMKSQYFVMFEPHICNLCMPKHANCQLYLSKLQNVLYENFT